MLQHAPRPARTRSGTAPTPLGLHDLSELTRSVAEQVRTGAHDVVLTRTSAGTGASTPTRSSTYG